MSGTQGKWPGETVPDYGCSGAAVARVNAAFVGRVQACPSSSVPEGAPGRGSRYERTGCQRTGIKAPSGMVRLPGPPLYAPVV